MRIPRSRAAFASSAAILLILLLAGPALAADDPKDPETCRELWEGLGLPAYAREPDEGTTQIVCHTRYVLSHNNNTRTPDWVLERLTKAQIKKAATRPSITFKSEENVPKEARATDNDYKKSGFDRGHQAPSEDGTNRVHR